MEVEELLWAASLLYIPANRCLCAHNRKARWHLSLDEVLTLRLAVVVPLASMWIMLLARLVLAQPLLEVLWTRMPQKVGQH